MAVSDNLSVQTTPIKLMILGHSLSLGCPKGQEEMLRDAAQILEERVSKMKGRSGILSMEKLLSIVALNLSYELMQEQQKTQTIESVIAQRIQQLDDSLENVIVQKAGSL